MSMYFKTHCTFTVTASLLSIMGNIREISQDLRKIIADLHKSGLSFGDNFQMTEYFSSVQTIVQEYKGRGTTQPKHRKAG